MCFSKFIDFLKWLHNKQNLMKIPKYTIGIYGINDICNDNYPTISHDHGLSVIKNGTVLHNIELERITRHKHSNGMPNAVYGLLKEKKLFKKNIDFVFADNITGRSFINTRGDIRFEVNNSDILLNVPEKGRLWLFDKVIDAYAVNHELAHIGSCLPFYGNFKNNSLLVHYDGGASKSNLSAWHYVNNKLTNVYFGWEYKWLTSLYNANALVFSMVKALKPEQNSVPGKFMGLAPYGKYSYDIEKWLHENNFFENIWGKKTVFFNSAFERFGIKIKNFDNTNAFIQNCAATIQQIFVRESFNIFNNLRKTTGASSLYYSGGCALNILLNSKIVNSAIFDNVYIPPCCNDSGLALGAASFFNWHNNINIKTTNAYINNWNIENYNTTYKKQNIIDIANALINNKIIGICNDSAECGPRALGNRSLLLLAGNKKLAQKVSMHCKKREWYRPVAPIMLERNTKYFSGLSNINPLSRFMLLDFNIKPEHITEIEGAVHTDGTARVQTIFTRNDNKFMYDLLDYLDKYHGIKALINTSFNFKGEPIVHTTNDAINSAKILGIDAIVINGQLQLLE